MDNTVNITISQVNVNKSIVIVQGCDRSNTDNSYGGSTGALTSSTNINVFYRARWSYVDWQVIEFY